ncbi:hypothetical protein BH11BAC3_BH11BAC3_40790 [soil metagenome]
MKNLLTDTTGVNNSFDRRQFITTAAKTACVAALANMPFMLKAMPVGKDGYTIQQVIDIILKEVPDAPFKTTVDTIKSGNANNKVTGIITTMFATIIVIKEAIRLNANFIIAHEPTFYNHADDTNWVENNKVVAEKKALLDKHQITVWRFHDYWHSVRPDGIFYGVVKKAGWEKYTQPGENTFTIPAATLKSIGLHLKSALNIDHIRVIGDLSTSCKKISLMPGAAGGQRQISVAEIQRPDLLIVGEVHEWETAEYVRDAALLGHNISLIVLGHSVSEEPGMEWLVDWLQPKIPGVNIHHIISNSPFTWL